MKVLKCLSMVSTQDYQGDLKASLAGGVCNTNNVFANRLYCIRLCHPNKIYLLTYLHGEEDGDTGQGQVPSGATFPKAEVEEVGRRLGRTKSERS